jgi:hypothetical protein
MTDVLEIENPAETITRLEAQLATVTLERDGLFEFVEAVFGLTMCAQSGNALKICESVYALARERRKLGVCKPDCQEEHSPQWWARVLNVARITVYRWMDEGLHYTPNENGMKTSRGISHASMRQFRAKRL